MPLGYTRGSCLLVSPPPAHVYLPTYSIKGTTSTEKIEGLSINVARKTGYVHREKIQPVLNSIYKK